MQELIKSLIERVPEIIKESASSPLGIISLLAILFAALSYLFFRKSNERWRFASLAILFTGSLLFGYATLDGYRKSEPNPATQVKLSAATSKFIQIAKIAKDSKTITPGAAIPANLKQAMNEFENAWLSASLDEKNLVTQKDVYAALDSTVRIHRTLEDGSENKLESLRWSDQAIDFFSETQSRDLLTESLLNKAAIFLDLAQLNNNDKELFERVSKDGNKLMIRAYQTSQERQKPEVLRITSRFYYLLARPRSFRLSEDWDNNYLQLAYQKVKEAYELAPSDIKNVNQLARATMRYAKNPPQDSDPNWTARIHDARDSLENSLKTNRSELITLEQRLSPLNVIGTATLEYTARAWVETEKKRKGEMSKILLSDIDSIGLPRLREAVALIQDSELRKSYGFDLYFDIARTLAIKSAILKFNRNDIQSQAAFVELQANLAKARENAKTTQIEAALKNINGEITFLLLTEAQRTTLRKLMAVS
jgi:hypothetical protein